MWERFEEKSEDSDSSSIHIQKRITLIITSSIYLNVGFILVHSNHNQKITWLLKSASFFLKIVKVTKQKIL